MDENLVAKVKGKSERFQPMMIRVSGEGERKRMSLVWPYVTVLEHGGRLFAGIRYFGREGKNHLEIFEAGKSAAILEISGMPYAVDREGCLYMAEQDPYPRMKRYKVILKNQ